VPTPKLGHPPFRLDQHGRGAFSVTMPTLYARCVSSTCSNPDLTPYECRQRIYVLASSGEDFAESLARVRCKAADQPPRASRLGFALGSFSALLRARACGQVAADYPDVEGGSGLELMRVEGLSCRRARHVIRECIQRFHLPGWHAFYDSDVLGHLRNHRKRIIVKGIAGGGPHCIPDPF
jgi:hypothetical protein